MRRKAFELLELLIALSVLAAIVGVTVPFLHRQPELPAKKASPMEQLEQRVLLLEVKVAKLEGVEK